MNYFHIIIAFILVITQTLFVHGAAAAASSEELTTLTDKLVVQIKANTPENPVTSEDVSRFNELAHLDNPQKITHVCYGQGENPPKTTCTNPALFKILTAIRKNNNIQALSVFEKSGFRPAIIQLTPAPHCDSWPLLNVVHGQRNRLPDSISPATKIRQHVLTDIYHLYLISQGCNHSSYEFVNNELVHIDAKLKQWFLQNALPHEKLKGKLREIDTIGINKVAVDLIHDYVHTIRIPNAIITLPSSERHTLFAHPATAELLEQAFFQIRAQQLKDSNLPACSINFAEIQQQICSESHIENVMKQVSTQPSELYVEHSDSVKLSPQEIMALTEQYNSQRIRGFRILIQQKQKSQEEQIDDLKLQLTPVEQKIKAEETNLEASRQQLEASRKENRYMQEQLNSQHLGTRNLSGKTLEQQARNQELKKQIDAEDKTHRDLTVELNTTVSATQRAQVELTQAKLANERYLAEEQQERAQSREVQEIIKTKKAINKERKQALERLTEQEKELEAKRKAHVTAMQAQIESEQQEKKAELRNAEEQLELTRAANKRQIEQLAATNTKELKWSYFLNTFRSQTHQGTWRGLGHQNARSAAAQELAIDRKPIQSAEQRRGLPMPYIGPTLQAHDSEKPQGYFTRWTNTPMRPLQEPLD